METTTGFEPVNRGFAVYLRLFLAVFFRIIQFSFVSNRERHDAVKYSLMVWGVVRFVSKMLANSKDLAVSRASQNQEILQLFLLLLFDFATLL